MDYITRQARYVTGEKLKGPRDSFTAQNIGTSQSRYKQILNVLFLKSHEGVLLRPSLMTPIPLKV